VSSTIAGCGTERWGFDSSARTDWLGEGSPQTIDLLDEAALRSPSSRNIDPWEFTFVEDREPLPEDELKRQKVRLNRCGE
jgi:nitroreductase